MIDGSYSITTLDAFVDSLIVDERVCEIQLPRMTQRKVLEETEGLPPRRSKLGKAMGVLGEPNDEEEEDVEAAGGERYVSRSPSLSESDREGSRSRSASVERFVSRSPSASPSAMEIDEDDPERIEGDA